MGSSRVGSNPTRSVTLQWEAISLPNHNLNLSIPSSLAAMAEWLRRLTRNQMGSSRVGSNPTRSVDASCIPPHFFINLYYKIAKLTTMGIEPTIFRFEVGRLIHWATRPVLLTQYFWFIFEQSNFVPQWNQKSFWYCLLCVEACRCLYWLRMYIVYILYIQYHVSFSIY